MALTNGAVTNFDLLAGSSLAVAGVTVVWSGIFVCPKDVTFSFEYKFASSGTVECDIAIEQSGTAPATPGTTDANSVIPDAKGNLISDVGDKLVHIIAYAPVVSNFLRIKVTGKGSNHASTVLERFIINTIVNA